MCGLGERLRAWRKERGITQDQMAARLIVHRTTYLRYESDQSEPPLETLCRIADILSCTTDDLLGRG